nr:unnamed protein product [Callosobruchus analis]
MSQIIRNFEDFDHFQDELEENCEPNLQILNKINRGKLNDDFTNALKLIDTYATQDTEEADVINLQTETERLTQLKFELESKVADYEKEIEKQKNDLQKLETDPKLQTMRDKIQACKLATKIHFVYEGTTDVCGYGIGATGKMKPFSFNPKEKTRKEITNALYEIMKSDKQVASAEQHQIHD